MCSRCLPVSAACALALLLLAGCERERREYHAAPAQAPAEHPRMSAVQAGAAQPGPPPSEIGRHYENNAYHVGQGARWYTWFNCNGCHGNGGGAIGPALMDDQWRYGGSVDQIHASILEGRPNGMPAWRGKLTDQQAWQLSAYVRSLSGNIRKDAVPSRRDAMRSTPPMTELPEQDPRGGDPSAQTVPQP